MIRLVTLVKKMNFWSGSQWIVIWRKKYRQEPRFSLWLCNIFKSHINGISATNACLFFHSCSTFLEKKRTFSTNERTLPHEKITHHTYNIITDYMVGINGKLFCENRDTYFCKIFVLKNVENLKINKISNITRKWN